MNRSGPIFTKKIDEEPEKFSQGGIVQTGGYANGGLVEYDPKLKDTLTPGSSEQAMPTSPMPTTAPQFTMDDSFSSLKDPALMQPPEPVPQDVPRGTSPNVPKMSLPGMPPVSPDDLEAYFNSKKQAVDKYGPAEQIALQKKQAEDRNSWQSRLGNAGTSFADALMQGVAGAGNPGFNDKFRAEQHRAEDQASGTLRSAHEQSLADMKEKMGFDAQDPKSSLSRASQKAYADTLIASGVPPKAVQNMSASLIGDVLSKRVTLADALSRTAETAAYHGADLKLRSHQIDVEDNQKKEQRKNEAIKELSGMPWYSRLLHPHISGQLEKDAGLEGASKHPQAKEAMQWAQQNPKDPRAADILKRLEQ